MNINTDIFKAYDIRGKYPSELDESVVERIGYATAEYITKKLRKKKGRFFVCRDVRISSKPLRDALVRGIITQGSDVIDAGVGTSPYFCFLMHQKKVDGGIMITASHNPREYNGLKIRGRRGESIFLGTGLEKIRAISMASKTRRAKPLGNIFVDNSYREKYISFFSKHIAIKRRIRVAIDAGGGSTTLFLPQILARFPNIEYTPLFFGIDGAFKKHPPNPLLPESQKWIKKELKRGKYNFGVSFDGDGDRVMFFDEKANVIDPQFIFLPLALEILKREKGRVFALPVDTSRIVRREIIRGGGKIRLCRRGYVFLQEAMRKFHSPASVERSGHYFFEEFSYDDSGIFAFLSFAEYVSRSSLPVSKIVEPDIPFASTGELNITVEDKAKAIANARNRYRRIPNARVSAIDGVTVEFPDWWFNIRQSNTEQVVRLVIEADTEELLREKRAEIEKLLR